jgi:tetratricopeptide (TPR) repeat protein
LFQELLFNQERVLGPEHPDLAWSLNGLAGLYRAQGRYAEAEPLYERALAIDERSFGPDQPNVATSLNDLAELLRTTNRLEEAEPLYRRALADPRKGAGPGAPRLGDIPRKLRDLTTAYGSLGVLSLPPLCVSAREFGADPDEVKSGPGRLIYEQRRQGDPYFGENTKDGKFPHLLVQLDKALDVQVRGAEEVRAVIFQVRHRDF